MPEINPPPRISAVERSTLKLGSFVDLAASARTKADYTVVATCGLDGLQNIFILNIVRGRWELPDAYEAAVRDILGCIKSASTKWIHQRF